MKTSLRSQVEPFRAMEVVAKAQTAISAGNDVIMMCVGQPASPAPAPALEAARKALEVGKIGYTNATGIAPLRKRLSQYYQDKYAVNISPERIIITTGSSAGFILSFLALFDPGDRIAIPAPGYPAYRNILRSLSLEPVELRTTARDKWVLSAETLENAHNQSPLAGVLIANPNNPNGTMMPPDRFQEVFETAQNLKMQFVSDEIYHGLSYTHPEVSALQLSDDTIVINSFSKYFCMTGWRIGWMIIPENLIETVSRLQQNAFICAPEISQIAALAALEGMDELELVKQGYARNRDLVLTRLRDLGFTNVHPIDGAFYAYADVSHLTDNSMELSKRLLDEINVALTPGADFDTIEGHKWMRFSFAGDHDRIADGFNRIEAWINKENRL